MVLPLVAFYKEFNNLQAFRGSGNLTHAITKAKKFEIIDHDGDEDEAYVRI